jgi:hypothetical protein
VWRGFYRREEGVRRSWAVAPANQRARAGVIAWDRDDVRGMASAGRGTEAVRVFTRRGREIEASGASGVCARARERFPGRVRRGLGFCGLCPWPWAELEREGESREGGVRPDELGRGKRWCVASCAGHIGEGAWAPKFSAMHKREKGKGVGEGLVSL